MGAVNVLVNNTFPEFARVLSDEIDSLEVMAGICEYELFYSAHPDGDMSSVNFEKDGTICFSIGYEHGSVYLAVYARSHSDKFKSITGSVFSKKLDVPKAIELANQLL